MDCPKCNSNMSEMKIETLHGQVVIDQCDGCQGLWFDHGEAEQLHDLQVMESLSQGCESWGKCYDR